MPFSLSQPMQEAQELSGSVFNPMQVQTGSRLIDSLLGALLPQNPQEALMASLFPQASFRIPKMSRQQLDKLLDRMYKNQSKYSEGVWGGPYNKDKFSEQLLQALADSVRPMNPSYGISSLKDVFPFLRQVLSTGRGGAATSREIAAAIQLGERFGLGRVPFNPELYPPADPAYIQRLLEFLSKIRKE